MFMRRGRQLGRIGSGTWTTRVCIALLQAGQVGALPLGATGCRCSEPVSLGATPSASSLPVSTPLEHPELLPQRVAVSFNEAIDPACVMGSACDAPHQQAHWTDGRRALLPLGTRVVLIDTELGVITGQWDLGLSAVDGVAALSMAAHTRRHRRNDGRRERGSRNPRSPAWPFR